MTVKELVGAARILYREELMDEPPWDGIVDPKTYEAINGWVNMGATKIGYRFSDNFVRFALAEMSLERLRNNIDGKTISLAILQQGRSGIRMKYFREVRLLPTDEQYLLNFSECSSIPITFEIINS